jgi:5-methylcytosine-specific restriction endonuclease McrA
MDADKREQLKAKNRAWFALHPEKRREYERNRRALGAGAAGSFTAEEAARHAAELGGACFYCAGPHEHDDHFIPISRGGTNELGNLVPACASCNTSKRNSDPTRFMFRRAETGRLLGPARSLLSVLLVAACSQGAA